MHQFVTDALVYIFYSEANLFSPLSMPAERALFFVCEFFFLILFFNDFLETSYLRIHSTDFHDFF